MNRHEALESAINQLRRAGRPGWAARIEEEPRDLRNVSMSIDETIRRSPATAKDLALAKIAVDAALLEYAKIAPAKLNRAEKATLISWHTDERARCSPATYKSLYAKDLILPTGLTRDGHRVAMELLAAQKPAKRKPRR